MKKPCKRQVNECVRVECVPVVFLRFSLHPFGQQSRIVLKNIVDDSENSAVCFKTMK